MKKSALFVGLLGLGVLGIMAPAAGLAHGPGGHGGQEFTAFSAAQKGMGLYDKLISGGKLDPSWETDFTAVQVSRRTIEGREEFIVKFSRYQGDPGAVYIFFDTKGEYRGSNFSGE